MKYFTHVRSLWWTVLPTIAPAATVTVGSQGTMYLKNPPPVIGHYDYHDVLYYEDSNHNNDATLQVDSNIGPSTKAMTRGASS